MRLGPGTSLTVFMELGRDGLGRKGIKITLLIVGVRLFGDARCSKDQPISPSRRGISGLCRRTWALIFLRGWRKLGEPVRLGFRSGRVDRSLIRL